MIDLQLVSYSSIGKGLLDLSNLNNQKKQVILVKILNATDKQIGILHLKVQYLFSLKKMYLDELDETRKLIEEDGFCDSKSLN